MNILLSDTKEYFYINDNFFNFSYNFNLINQVLNTCIYNSKFGIKLIKNRALVKGSGKKLWAQKGLGKARIGDGKAPQHRSGGAAFMSKSKFVVKKNNKKMYRLVLKYILSYFFNKNKIILVNKWIINEINTKNLIHKISNFTKEKKILFILYEFNSKLNLSLRNLNFINVNYYPKINILKIINSDALIIEKKVFEILGEQNDS